MQTLVRLLALLEGEERGVTVVEYGLIVFVISLAVMGAAALLGQKVLAVFTAIPAV